MAQRYEDITFDDLLRACFIIACFPLGIMGLIGCYGMKVLEFREEREVRRVRIANMEMQIARGERMLALLRAQEGER